jgi:hypothetical protein
MDAKNDYQEEIVIDELEEGDTNDSWMSRIMAYARSFVSDRGVKIDQNAVNFMIEPQEE